MSKVPSHSDVVFTPSHIAKAIVDKFSPCGRILEPSSGDGSFLDFLPGADWAEISKGKDFFDITNRYDWIVGNPPYSILNEWLKHSFKIADHIVYLLPVAKVFGSKYRLDMIHEFGGIVEIYAPWTGRQIGFDFGWPCGAIYFSKGYRGGTIITI